MRCPECVILISRKLDGTLTDLQAKELEGHLAHCNHCRAELALQRKLVYALKQDLPERLPGDFTRRVTGQAARLAGEERRRRFRLNGLLPVIPVAAAATLLVIFGRDLAGAIVPVMESVADATGGPLAAFGDGIAEALRGAASAQNGSLPGAGLLARVFSNAYVGLSIASAAVVWAFSRAYTFVRH